MNSVRTIIVALGTLLASTSTLVQAYDGFGCGYAFPWFGYGNQGPAAYALGNIPAPPYFALHPPVYYSHVITPRTYGRSPFACPCNCHDLTRWAAPRVVANPYVGVRNEKRPQRDSEKTSNVAAVPAKLVNPFYQLANRENRLAQEIPEDQN